jgi:hypothetical protein
MTAYSPQAMREIIRTALHLIDLWSPEAEELIIGTAAKESHLGKWLQQIGGPARGVCQVEPKTEFDNWYNYLRYRDGLRERVTAATGLTAPNLDRLKNDPIYNVVMARIWYLRRPKKIPPAYDVQALAEYWNDEYNINPVHGHPHEFVGLYHKLVLRA